MTPDRTSLRAHPSLAVLLATGHLVGAIAAWITLDRPASLIVIAGLAISLYAQHRRLATQREEVALVSPSGEVRALSASRTSPLDGQVLMPGMLVVANGNRDARLVVASPSRLRRLRVALRWGRPVDALTK